MPMQMVVPLHDIGAYIHNVLMKVYCSNIFPGHCQSNASRMLTAHRAHGYFLQCIVRTGGLLFPSRSRQFMLPLQSSLDNIQRHGIKLYKCCFQWKWIYMKNQNYFKNVKILLPFVLIRKRSKSSEESFVMGWVGSTDGGVVDPFWQLAQCKPFALSHYYSVSQLCPSYMLISISLNPSVEMKLPISDTKVESSPLPLIHQCGALKWGV